MFAKEGKKDKNREVYETNEETFHLNFNQCYPTNYTMWYLLPVQKRLNVLVYPPLRLSKCRLQSCIVWRFADSMIRNVSECLPQQHIKLV
jgi:hypothetical protein